MASSTTTPGLDAASRAANQSAMVMIPPITM
jgi:hypothetical protein